MTKTNISDRRLPPTDTRLRQDRTRELQEDIDRRATTAELIGTREEIYAVIDAMPSDGLSMTSRVMKAVADEASIEVTPTVGAVQGVIRAKDDGIQDKHIAAGVDATKISSGGVSNEVFDHLIGVGSPIQGQLDAKISNTTLSWEAPLTGVRLVKDSGTGTFTVTDASLTDTGDADAILAISNFLDGRVDRQLLQFPLPAELDKAFPVTVTVYFRVSALDANDSAHARLSLELRNIPVNALLASGGVQLSVATDFLVADLAGGTLQTATFTEVLTTDFLQAGAFLHGSIARLGTHANDTYTGSIQILNVLFSGQRLKA